jgi:hypothetical protein
MKALTAWFFALTVFVLLQTSGCTLKATFESTTDTTSNFLSSTTPGAWVTEDGLLKAEHKVTAFAALNQSNLEQDMARGSGEYLASLGALLGATDETQRAFQAKAQEDFLQFLPADHATRVQQLRGLSR